MDVTIIGTGNMARGIGTRVVAGGHPLTVLGVDRSKAEALAGELDGETRAGVVGDAIAGDVVVAVWYPVSLEVVERYGPQLDGKVVVDISNPLDVETFEPVLPDAGSGAQVVAAAVPAPRW
jgi:predicted dinucleotide-binding enzyme